ncbi:MAG TPA: DsbA family protein [Solirubrobacteraceae bacterium]|nr:DsbA family protein [Solirubrobacteraceae bacterium]
MRAAFYYDLFSPEAYLTAERIINVLPAAEWIPIYAPDLPGADLLDAFLCQTDREAFFDRIERLALRRGLQPIRWPDPFPSDTAFAMRVATYAARIGRAVAFSLAAFRQAFAGGRDLGVPDNVLIAAAACEMHPRAVAKGAELDSVARALEEATALAARRGVRGVPAVWLPDGPRHQGEVFHGDDALDGAVRALIA